MAIRYKCPHCRAKSSVADEHAGQVASCAQCGRFTVVPGDGSPARKLQTDAADVHFIDEAKKRVWPVGLLKILGVLLILLLLVALLLPAIRTAPRAAYRMQCSNNLKQIGLAMHTYHDVYGCFPPPYVTDDEGRPMHSWRVLLLPFLDQQQLYDVYLMDEPWDSPNNLAVYDRMPECYRCPGGDEEEEGLSHYVVIVGDPEKFPQTPFTPDRGTSFRDIKDGTSNTILAAEVRYGVPWTMPTADLTFDTMTMRIGEGPAAIGGRHVAMANVVLGDGSIRQISKGLEPDLLRLLLQPADGEETPWDF